MQWYTVSIPLLRKDLHRLDHAATDLHLKIHSRVFAAVEIVCELLFGECLQIAFALLLIDCVLIELKDVRNIRGDGNGILFLF